MTRAFAILAALCLCSCASPRVAPRFDKPSTQPIAQAHKKAIGHVEKANAQAKVLANEIEQKDPPLQLMKLQVTSLQVDLDSALTELNTSEGMRKQLDVQLGQQTDKANKLAVDYDMAHLEISSLKNSRHRWVKYALYAAGLALVEGLWIFRKPLLMLVAGGV